MALVFTVDLSRKRLRLRDLRPVLWVPGTLLPHAAAILFDYRVLGDALWGRFNGGAEGTRWYYQSLANIFSEAMPGRLSDRLSRAATAFSVRNHGATRDDKRTAMSMVQRVFGNDTTCLS